MVFPKTVACVGAGTVGSSWALLFGSKGHEVIVYDLNGGLLRKAAGNIRVMSDALVRNGILTKKQADRILERISTTTRLPDLAAADYVQESVVERLDVKINVFGKLENVVRDEVIIASSTSGLLMTDMQLGMRHPERAIIAHPFNPPHLIPLVEIVSGENTASETVKITRDFMVRLGKEPIVLDKEISGFVANRIQAVVFREVLSMLENGVVGMEDLDKVFYAGLGLRLALMGPFVIHSLAGGEGGLVYYMEHFGQLLQGELSSASTWTSIPDSVREMAVSRSKELPLLKKRSYRSLIRWRDDRLIMLLKHLGYLRPVKS